MEDSTHRDCVKMFFLCFFDFSCSRTQILDRWAGCRVSSARRIWVSFHHHPLEVTMRGPSHRISSTGTTITTISSVVDGGIQSQFRAGILDLSLPWMTIWTTVWCLRWSPEEARITKVRHWWMTVSVSSTKDIITLSYSYLSSIERYFNPVVHGNEPMEAAAHSASSASNSNGPGTPTKSQPAQQTS